MVSITEGYIKETKKQISRKKIRRVIHRSHMLRIKREEKCQNIKMEQKVQRKDEFIWFDKKEWELFLECHFPHCVLNACYLSHPLFLKTKSVKWVLKSPFYWQGNGKANGLNNLKIQFIYVKLPGQPASKNPYSSYWKLLHTDDSEHSTVQSWG